MDKSNIFRLLAVVILSSLTTYFLYRSQIINVSKRPITVSFTARGNVDSPFALYYTEDDSESFSEEKKAFSENSLKTENTKFDIQLPCTHVAQIRVDFFEKPGVVYISDISIKGDKKILFTYNDVKITNDLTFEQVPEGIKITSDKIDPFIIIPDLNINQSAWFVWITGLIAWVLLSLLYWCILRYMYRKMNTGNEAFLLLILLMLFVPRFFVSEETVSVVEKRTLTEKPKLNFKEDMKGYGGNYEKWFNDHFFLREELQSLHDGILNVFNGSQGRLYKDAFVGEDQWMFLRKYNGFENYANVNLFTKEELESVSLYLQYLEQCCTQKGMKFYFVIVPDKEKVYGEYYKYVEKVNPDSLGRAQQLIKYLKKNTDLKCLSLHDRLIKEKDKDLLYYKQGTHWTELGAYYGVDELLSFISSDMELNRSSIASLDSMLKLDGDILGLCPGYKKQDEHYYKTPVLNAESSVSFEDVYYHYRCPSRQGKITVLGDSFGFLLTKYLSYSFGESQLSLHARRGSFFVPKEEIDTLNSDCVVYEVVERSLPQLTIPERLWR